MPALVYTQHKELPISYSFFFSFFNNFIPVYNIFLSYFTACCSPVSFFLLHLPNSFLINPFLHSSLSIIFYALFLLLSLPPSHLPHLFICVFVYVGSSLSIIKVAYMKMSGRLYLGAWTTMYQCLYHWRKMQQSPLQLLTSNRSS